MLYFGKIIIHMQELAAVKGVISKSIDSDYLTLERSDNSFNSCYEL